MASEGAPRAKRPRHDHGREDREVDTDDDTVPGDIDTSQIMLSRISTQTERDIAATSQFPRQTIDDGVIEKLLLVDFMCHRKLEVHFNVNVNFVLGQNGSGKSAIMTAIIVALGGKAISTQRASSLKSFIRTGCSQADIHLTLRNRGEEAYKPKEYGHCITVVRSIRRDGASSYKLKNSRGHVMASAKDELLRILDHFNIQVDNPVCMLSQDTSRNFLHSSNPSNMFKLFMKGTHLEKIAHDYAQAEEKQRIMKEEIIRKKSMLPVLEMKAKQLEEEVQDIERLQKLEDKERQLLLELMWALARETEISAKNAEDEVLKETERLENIERKISILKEKQERKKEDQEETKKQLQEGTSEVSVTNAKRNELLEKKRPLERQIHELMKRSQTINREMCQVRNEKKEFEAKLDELKNRNPQAIVNQRVVLTVELESVKEKIADIEGKLKTARCDYQQKEEEIQQVNDKYQSARSSVSQTEKELRECDESLQRLISSDNPLSGFGQWMTDLVQTLHQHKKQFRHFPKGPIGSLIKIKDQQWCFAIECAIGFGNLCGFLVDNHEDEFKFKSLAKQVIHHYPGKRVPTCFKSKFLGQVYDFKRNIPHCSYPVLINMITVNDPDVINILIDVRSIENTLLIAEKGVARQVMSRPPTNARSAYTICGDQVLPNDRYYSNKIRHPYGILHASKAESITQQRHFKQQLSEKLRGYEEEERTLSETVTNFKRQQDSIKRYISTKQRRQQEMRKSKEELQAKIEEIDDTNQEEDIDTWKSEIQELEEKLQGQQNERDQVITQVSDKREKLKKHLEDIERYDQRVQEVANNVEELKAAFKIASDELGRATRIVIDHQGKGEQIKRKLQEAKRKYEEARSQHEDTVKTAKQHCPKIETERSSTSIQREIEKIQKKLTEEADRRDNQDHIRQNYLEAVEQLEATDTAIKREVKSLESLNLSLTDRIKGYQDIRKRVARRTIDFFNHFVRRRGYLGTLNFNFERKSLEIIVKVNKQQATKNIRSLSGGERSFATVSFIMALWEAMESPFRCLDEFDVFMDLMNRRISMQLMLEGAETLQSKQFIFLTPQDMSTLGIKYPDRCKILRLNAPDRTQCTLD